MILFTLVRSGFFDVMGTIGVSDEADLVIVDGKILFPVIVHHQA